MLKNNLTLLAIIGGIALIYVTFAGSQHAKVLSDTMTVAQVVQEFNDTKRIIASTGNVPVETIPEISEEDLLASMGHLYAASDATSGQKQTLEAAICTQRLPVCTHIRVADTGELDSQEKAQLELRFVHSETSHWFSSDEILPGFGVPLEL